RYFADGEVPRGFLDQRGELRRVARILFENPHGGYYVCLDPAGDVRLDPQAPLAGDAALLVVPALKTARREPGRINLEVCFNGRKWGGALGNQFSQNRSVLCVLVERRYLHPRDWAGKVAALVRFQQVG